MLTLTGDLLKGIAPILIAQELGAPSPVLALCGLFAFLGHLYPVYFEFHGGKGVATAIGVILALHWPAGLMITAIWCVVIWFTRTSSLAAIISWSIAPFIVYATATEHLTLCLVLSLMLIIRHRKNVIDLIKGNEYQFRDDHHKP